MEEDRYTRITLRLPKALHATLDRAADDSSKSLNAEIVARLENTVAWEQRARDADQRASESIRELRKLTGSIGQSREQLVTALDSAVSDAHIAKSQLGAVRAQLAEARDELSVLRSKAGGADVAVFARALDNQQRLIQLLGLYIGNLAGRIKSDDPTTNKLMKFLVDMGIALERGNGAEATEAVAKVVALGVDLGQLTPEQDARTKSMQPRRRPKS